MSKIVDASGLSCPEPVILTRKALKEALKEDTGKVCIIVDTMTHVENCTRTAEKLGWTVRCEEDGDQFRMEMEKKRTEM